MSGLTVRIDAGGVVASDDQGRQAQLPAEIGPLLREAFDRAGPGPADGLPTAAAHAALAEARAARPKFAHGPPAPWQDVRAGPRVPLTNLTARRSRPLGDVLAARRSRRAWTRPTLGDLGAVLVAAARITDWAVEPDGYVTSRRPAPSAGARHPLDLHVLAGEVDGLPAGAWRFDGLRSELVGTSRTHEPVLRMLGEVVGSEVPPAAVVAVAHLRRTLSRYPTGLSLLWRDAGALLATLHLCATDLGLASCIAGTCGALVDEPGEAVVDVGALLLGRPKR